MASLSERTKTPEELAAETIKRLQADRYNYEKHAELRAELEARVRDREAQYGIASSEVHAAIDDGRLIETEDVCDWIMDYELLIRKPSRAA